jgi:hypothetical protein
MSSLASSPLLESCSNGAGHLQGFTSLSIGPLAFALPMGLSLRSLACTGVHWPLLSGLFTGSPAFTLHNGLSLRSPDSTATYGMHGGASGVSSVIPLSRSRGTSLEAAAYSMANVIIVSGLLDDFLDVVNAGKTWDYREIQFSLILTPAYTVESKIDGSWRPCVL